MNESERAKTAEESYTKMRKQLDERLKSDSQLTSIAKKIKNGSADFKDTAKYSEIVSNHIGEVLQENIGNISTPLGKKYACQALLKDHYESINDVLGKVQVSVDQQNGIHITPQKAEYPAERVEKVANSLTDNKVPQETIKRRAKGPVANVANSMHDDYIKANAEFRSKAGLDVYVVRKDHNGCCEWCSKLAGKYAYPDEVSEDVYRRHDNCTCTVTYENGRMHQDVWSKKSWQATDEELERRNELNKSKPMKLSREEAKAKEREVLEKNPLTFGRKSDIIKMNQSKSLDIFNDYDISTSSPITAQQIIDELGKSDIGKQTLKDIENLPKRIKLSSEVRHDGVRGEEFGGAITIYLSNCENPYWAARTVIHECTHQKYGIGGSQWAECVCVAQELKHARNRNFLTYSEKKTIVKAVKEAYPEYNWRRGGLVNGKRKK